MRVSAIYPLFFDHQKGVSLILIAAAEVDTFYHSFHQVAVKIHCHIDPAVAELALNVSESSP